MKFDIINKRTHAKQTDIFSLRNDGRLFKEIPRPTPGYPHLVNYLLEEVDLDENEIIWRDQ